MIFCQKQKKLLKKRNQPILQKSKEKSSQKVYARPNGADIDPTETQEWLDSLTAVVAKDGTERAHYLLKKLIDEAYKEGSTSTFN